MAEKLKLISGRIHWSLVAKAIGIGLGWYVLPFWLFLVLAAYFYLRPLFRPFQFVFPFLVFIVIISPAFFDKSLWLAGLIAVGTFLVLGTKNLVLVERKSSYQIFILILLSLAFLAFFSDFQRWNGLGVVLGSFLVSLVFFLLVRNLIKYEDSVLTEVSFDIWKVTAVAGLAAFLIWQALWVFLFMPFNYLSQAAALLVFSFSLIEILLAYLREDLTPRKILAHFSVFFVFMVLVLTGNKWSL